VGGGRGTVCKTGFYRAQRGLFLFCFGPARNLKRVIRIVRASGQTFANLV